MHKLTDLKIWNKAIELSVEVYKVTSNFPKEEVYGLTSQIKRAAISIPSNISEGAGRSSEKEFIYFFDIANGSTFELQTQLIIANKLNLINHDTYIKLLKKIEEIQKMNYTFQKTLNKKVSSLKSQI